MSPIVRTENIMSTTEAPQSKDYESATNADASFNNEFTHHFRTISGLQMHYVLGGKGPTPIVLLHGFPQSWYEWRHIMPSLLDGHTVIAIDLPGLGDSSGRLSSYRKMELAQYVDALLTEIGIGAGIQLVAHDFGSAIAYALCHQFRSRYAGLFLIDFGLTGRSLSFDTLKMLSFHFSFFFQKPLAEDLVAGRENVFLSYFYDSLALRPETITPSARAEYTRVYSRPGVWGVGMEWYRAWPEDEADNASAMSSPLQIPAHVLTQEATFDFFLPALRDAAPAATGESVANTGHWIPEEQSDRVIQAIRRFYEFSGA
jgi:pimeloyl-ACP methyl ester carboxylesterase